jgi:hypothetical protein
MKHPALANLTGAFAPNLIDLSMPAFINELVGNEVSPDNFTALEKQVDLIRGELLESYENIHRRHRKGLQDDIQDLLFTTIGLAYRAGLLGNGPEDFQRVCNSQMSKFDLNPADAETTLDAYAAKGIKAYTVVREINGVTYYVTKSAEEQIDLKGDKIGKDKWLKSFRFEEPVLTTLENETAEPATFTKEDLASAKQFAADKMAWMHKTLNEKKVAKLDLNEDFHATFTGEGSEEPGSYLGTKN